MCRRTVLKKDFLKIAEYAELNGPDVRFDEPRVLNKLRTHHMHRWLTNNYNLTNTTQEYGEFSQSRPDLIAYFAK
jgi:hypothetical protein